MKNANERSGSYAANKQISAAELLQNYGIAAILSEAAYARMYIYRMQAAK